MNTKQHPLRKLEDQATPGATTSSVHQGPHWSWDERLARVQRAESWLKFGKGKNRGGKPAWMPSEIQIEQAMRLLDTTREDAITLLRAARKLQKP